jgi:glycosyltransferase involved in cell wall biosynthesis
VLPKNLLLIIPEMNTGGAQRSLANLSIELSAHFKIWLVVFNRERPVTYKHGGEMLSLDVIPGRLWVSKILAFYKRVVRLKKIKSELHIDVAISFLEGADYVNILSQVREKVILSIRGSKIHDEIMKGQSFWLRSKILIPLLYKKADMIISVNFGIANELISHYKLDETKIQVIGNFYDSEAIEKLSKERKTTDLENFYFDFPILVFTGRLNKEKGVEYLLRILSKLKGAGSSAKLVIVGDGPEGPFLIDFANQMNLNVGAADNWNTIPDVVFVGNQENVFQFLNKATLYLMNSSSEGFPNGIVEAMICKVPVISSNCPYGPAEILAPDIKFNSDYRYDSPNGILMPIVKSDKEIDEWVVTIQNLLDDDGLRYTLSEKAFLRAMEFRKDEVIKKWLKVIHE